MKNCTINSKEFSFVDRGTGPVILFVHGFPLDHTMWNAQIKTFSTHHRVIAPDLHGFGQSGVTEGTTTMWQFADDLAAILDYLTIREPVVLCGLSMGGYIAFEFWRRFPTRLRGLILCDTRAAGDTPEGSAGRLAMAQRVISEGVNWIPDTVIPKMFAAMTLQNQGEIIQAIRQVIECTDPRGIAAASKGMAQRSDFTDHLPQIQCPTLLLAGENDAITPPVDMQKIAHAIPNAQFTSIPNAGHMAPLEQPNAVNSAIESFLQRL